MRSIRWPGSVTALLSALRGKVLPHRSVWWSLPCKIFTVQYQLYKSDAKGFTGGCQLECVVSKSARSGIDELLLRSSGVVTGDSGLPRRYALCRRVNNYRRFGRTYCLHLQDKAV